MAIRTTMQCTVCITNVHPIPLYQPSALPQINNNYFSNLCLPDPSSAWLIDFVDKSCPSSMQVSRGGKCACDTTKADCPDEVRDRSEKGVQSLSSCSKTCSSC
jgi:hypothetical protein